MKQMLQEGEAVLEDDAWRGGRGCAAVMLPDKVYAVVMKALDCVLRRGTKAAVARSTSADC
jgi:hypothetical protein